ncbi:MAG: oxygen-independent coproporphyrinogen III oxidase [Clostridia bacterium]|nr:oxygen-independent coproporphyrinogen III oxidase [Clostridia bacterium]
MKGLYVHIPFCIKKCKYCDFNSFSACEKEKDAYLGALILEMEKYRGETVDTVFIGGGTPTSLSVKQLKQLLGNIQNTFVLAGTCEFTVEANPKTLDEEKLETLKKYGVNRLSIGVQSFCDNELSALGRVHTGIEAEETISLAKKYFDNISIDLMCAIPDQTKESFRQNLEKAFSFGLKHISCYSLILEEGTPLFDENEKGNLVLPDEDAEREIYEIAVCEMGKHGYLQYEISNFAKSGFESAHNKKYWQCDEYIGIGLSAHSYLDGVRFSNTDDFSSYIKGEFLSGEKEVLSKEDQMSEFMFLGLRMTDGVSKTEFAKRFLEDLEKVFEKPLSKFKNMGMIEEKGDRICLTKKAISVSNQVMCEFIL